MNARPSPRPMRGAGAILAAGAAALLLVSGGLYLRARVPQGPAAAASRPRPVAVRKAERGSYRDSRRYVGTLAPWVAAKVGPQYVSAYVSTVLVRPGDLVKAGQVLGTLDCRSSSAGSRATAARAQSVAERQAALASELERMKQLSEGGFASPNEIEQLRARAQAEAAELEGQRAALQSRTLEVDDCVLRAPFAGEVAERYGDPGAYLRPGSALVSLLDRATVRAVAAAPESDFAHVAPGAGAEVAILATGQRVSGAVSRRAPGADAETRTVDFEIDLPNGDRRLPAQTTAEITIPVGAARPAAVVTAPGATVRGARATVYTVEGGRARRRAVSVLGEAEGKVYLDPAQLPPGTPVVVEGRALLGDGDAVDARELTQ